MARICHQMTALDIWHAKPTSKSLLIFCSETHEVTFRFFQDKIYNTVHTDLINIGFSQAPMFNTDC